MESDILLPDGIGIVAALKFLTGKKVKKITGSDIHQFLLNKIKQNGGRCFYLGSSEETLAKIQRRLSMDFPTVKVAFYSPPYKKQFNEAENRRILEAVNSFKPDVLFIGMTAPKQEKWAYANKEQLDARVICSIGAVFDFYAGTIKRPDKIWINLGLEWLGRLMKEPERMWKRYFLLQVQLLFT